MNEFEVVIEDMNPCGGAAYAKREIIEVETDSPESYVRKHGRIPIMEQSVNASGDVVIITGDGKGNIVKYIFTE